MESRYYSTGDEDDDSLSGNIYTGGHWEWDSKDNTLVFISDVVPEIEKIPYVPIEMIGPIQFKDNLDLLEQLKFKKRVQRKSDRDDDVVTLQDVKDVVLYTAPPSLIYPLVINVMHQPTTERYLRALILYCQYYIQVTEEMAKRIEERERKIYTPNSQKIESMFRDNLQDLRILISKEYNTMILGADDVKKFHHKGIEKKLHSLSRSEAKLFEAMMRLSIQIVWISLGRKWFKVIEIEVNRLFRSKTFNLAEHRYERDSEYSTKSNERGVFVGKCLHLTHKLKTHSPLLDELQCLRKVDYRLLGLGVIKYPILNDRLRFLETLLISDEYELNEMGLSLGIVGLPRARFDTMLREIRLNPSRCPSVSSFRMSMSRINFRYSTKISADQKSGSTKAWSNASTSKTAPKLFEDLIIPEGSIDTTPPEDFPSEKQPKLRINRKQHKRWLKRAIKLANRFASRKSKVPYDKHDNHSETFTDDEILIQEVEALEKAMRERDMHHRTSYYRITYENKQTTFLEDIHFQTGVPSLMLGKQ